VRRLEPDEERLRRDLATGPVTDARLFGLVQAQHAERLGCARWGEQVRSIERFADPIFEAFPDARMLHMIRDPRERFGASEHQGPGSVGWHTAMWRQSAALAERNVERYPQGYRVVRFEALAAEPDATLEDVCAFVGVDPTSEMREVLAAGLHGDAQGTPTPAQRAFVERDAGPGLRTFGYATAKVGASGRDRAVALATRPFNRATMAAWRLTVGRTGPAPVRG